MYIWNERQIYWRSRGDPLKHQHPSKAILDSCFTGLDFNNLDSHLLGSIISNAVNTMVGNEDSSRRELTQFWYQHSKKNFYWSTKLLPVPRVRSVCIHLASNTQNTKGYDHGFVGWEQKAMIMAVFFWHFEYFHWIWTVYMPFISQNTVCGFWCYHCLVQDLTFS